MCGPVEPALILPEPIRTTIRAAAEAAYPRECCGLLVGVAGADGAIAVTEAVAADNVAAGDRRDRFEVDPRVRIAVEKRVRGSGRRLVGHYHSHPDAPPVPSATDLARVDEPDLLWLVVAVGAGGAGEMAAFRFDAAHGAFVACALHADGVRELG